MHLLKEELELLCLVLWRVWYNRNRRIHDVAELRIDEIVPWAMAFHDDYKRANKISKEEVTDRRSYVPLWQPPREGV
ncbi:hypothetical protein Dsin_005532 [Dipteronia sinensis]|uniref:Uncharacterized protein n=1 Tax=Dipteronia sinensis TaxID=43782 RepID=A0AAE0EGL2_9ROSI|nr:hypothetical protein Dsin_005532 [Dipteronia sinensis]